MHGVGARFAASHVRVDVLDDDDGIVDHEADRRRHTAERHQIEAQPDDPHRHERDQDRDRDDERGHEGRPPVAEEAVEDGHGEDEADEDGVAHRGHRAADEQRLVVVRTNVDVARQVLAKPSQFRLHVVGDGDDVGGRLPQHVQQHGRSPVRSDDREARLESGADSGDVADAYRHIVDRRHDDRGKVVDRDSLAAHQCQLELVILVDQPRRGDDVRTSDRVGNLLEGNTTRLEPHPVDEHVVLAQLPAQHLHAGHAIDPRHRRTERDLGEVAQRSGIALRRRDAVADDREDRKGEPVGPLDRRTGRQPGGELRHLRLHDLQRLHDVGLPVEEEIDLRRTAPRRRLDARDPGDAAHGFLDRLGHGDEGLLRGSDAVLRDDDDARKVGLRKQRAGNARQSNEASDRKKGDHEQHRALLIGNDPAEVHQPFSAVALTGAGLGAASEFWTFVPSGSP